MFNRKVISYLKIWKDKKVRKPLIVRGARQVGKTSAVLLFGRKKFENTIHINLEKPEHRRLFQEEVSLAEFETIVNVSLKQKLQPGKTLLFIDEIQEAPHLVKLLRFFYEEKPELHVIAAGSLFEVRLREKGFTIPVGRVEYVYMHPLDFFEFLNATEKKELHNYLKKVDLNKNKIPLALHKQGLAAFQNYALIGGMPEAIQEYNRTKNISAVNQIYSNIHISFQDDAFKYSSTAESKYLIFIIDQAPLFAGLPITYENFADSSYRSREISQAFEALEATMLLYQTRATNSHALPLVTKRKKPPKLIHLDVGLVSYRMGIQDELIQLDKLDDFYRGRLAEQVVGQQLIASFLINPPSLFYWYKNKHSQAEIDFCLTHKGKVIGFEVKSGATGRLKSLHEFVRSTQNSIALRIYSGQLKIEKNFVSLPFYLLPRWKEVA